MHRFRHERGALHHRRLARRTGVPVRTIRFWSDTGVIAPTGRSDGGYRLYDAAAVARLDLVRTRATVRARAAAGMAEGSAPEPSASRDSAPIRVRR